MLSRLEEAIQRQQPTGAEYTESLAVADILNDIDEVTRKLSDALGALERLNGEMGLLLQVKDDASSQEPRSPSALTASSDDGNRISTGPSSWSFSSNRASLSHRLSVNSNPANAPKPEEEKQVVPLRKTSRLRSTPTDVKRTSRPREASAWSASLAYIDPLSVDIDSASSLIMGGELATRKGTSPTSATNTLSSGQKSNVKPVVQQSHNQSGSLSPPTSPQRSPAAFHLRDPTHGFGRKGSLQVTSKTPEVQRLERPPYETKSVSMPLLSSTSKVQGVQENLPSQHTAGSPIAMAPEISARSHETAIHSEASSVSDSTQSQTQAQESPSILPIRRPSHFRARALFRSAQAVKSKYRIVNPEKDGMTQSDPRDSEGWVYSPVSAFAPFSPQSIGQEPLLQPTSFFQHAALPIGSTMAENIYKTAPIAELDDGPVSSIVRFWNEGQWDQAKTQAQRLVGNSVHLHPQIARRMHHLAGVAASLQGELETALIHFLKVFEAPVIDTHQLDVGHCAAAHWMGDIYTLLKRDTEAFLAYSIASRSPLLQDSRRESLRACIFAERAATDQGNRALNWDRSTQATDSEGTDSISNGRIIDPDCTRILMGTDIQPTSKAGGKTCTLDPSRSRAMTIHNASPPQPSSWQEEHRLQIDAASLSPCSPWPFPYDPLFALESVRRHRLAVVETDLLQIGLSATKIPKKTRLSFTCPDLRWLIVTLRKCLVKLEMQWSETVGDGNPSFMVRYASRDGGFGSVRFFSVPIHRLSFRPGYGVEICPEGVCSSRVKSEGPEFDKGVHKDEAKRVKKGIREFLEAAARRQEALEGGNNAVLPVVSINGVTSLHRR